MSTKDPFGDRMKGYEALTEFSIPKNQGVIVRVDGRAFHTLTRPLHRFSSEDGVDGWPNLLFTTCMVQAAEAVAKDFRPDILYVQSDEVTLAWFPQIGSSEFPFGGRTQKLASLCAAKMSVHFCELLQTLIPSLGSGSLPIFDGRCFGVPNVFEVANAVLWRMFDADKNAIQTIARKSFSKAEIMKVSNKDLRNRLLNFDPETDNQTKEEWVYQNVRCFVNGTGHLTFSKTFQIIPNAEMFRLEGVDSSRYWEYVFQHFPEHFPKEKEHDEAGIGLTS